MCMLPCSVMHVADNRITSYVHIILKKTQKHHNCNCGIIMYKGSTIVIVHIVYCNILLNVHVHMHIYMYVCM